MRNLGQKPIQHHASIENMGRSQIYANLCETRDESMQTHLEP